MIRVETIPGDVKRSNIYIVGDNTASQAVLIDPGHNRTKIIETLVANRWKLTAIFLTRGGLEHAARAAECRQRFQVPLYTHPRELIYLQRLPALAERAGLCGVKSPQVDGFLKGNHIKQCGEIKVEVIEIESESSASVVLKIGPHFFVGGLLGVDGPTGRTEGQGGLSKVLSRAEKKSKVYPSMGKPFDAVKLRSP